MRIVTSRLARHVSAVCAKLTSNEISILALNMPQLSTLQCEVTPSDARMMVLPPKLHTLVLNLSKLNAEQINRAVRSIGRLTALLDLTLQLDSWLAVVSFAPLSNCAALTNLTIKGPPMKSQPTDAHIDQLRALQHLRTVSVDGLNSRSLSKLLRAPHSLEWTELHELRGVDAASAPALCTIPNLLAIQTFDCCDVSFLSALSQLHTLELQIKDGPWAVSGDAVVEAISSCRHLTSFALRAPVTSAHLTALLPRLPMLHTLSLVSCRELVTLQFLRGGSSLKRTLRSLCLSGHPALRASEIRYAFGLKNLVSLRLLDSFSESLDSLTQHLLTPPSNVLPKLTSFEYKPVAATEV